MCCITNIFECFKVIQIGDNKTRKKRKIIILTFGKSIFIMKENNKIKMRKFREGWKIDAFSRLTKNANKDGMWNFYKTFSGETIKFAENVLRIYGEAEHSI
jgi:hypothetical protein